MADVPSDQDLLAAYLDSGSSEAFGQLVGRYVRFVYSAAMRQVGDEHLADEVTQAVFIVLARKARAVRGASALPGWLFNTTRFAAANLVKTERRRRRYERDAARERPVVGGGAEAEQRLAWEEMQGVLDDALDQLRQADRTVVLMRYFQGRSVREVSEALRISEDAGKKRLSRAVQRLRWLLAERGVALSAGAMLAAIVAHGRHAVPTELVSRCVIRTFTALNDCSGPSTASVTAADTLRTLALKRAGVRIAAGFLVILCALWPAVLAAQHVLHGTAEQAWGDAIAAEAVRGGAPAGAPARSLSGGAAAAASVAVQTAQTAPPAAVRAQTAARPSAR